MATTDEDLKQVQGDIAAKKKLLAEKQRKAAEMQRLIQNDQTLSALDKESQALDAELAQADEHLKALEEASGISADSIKLPVTRESSTQAAPSVQPVQLVPVEAAEGEAPTATGTKRASK